MSEKNKTIEQKVIKILKEQFGNDIPISPNTSLINDLNADSLDHIEIVDSLEGEFEIEIPGEDIDEGLVYGNVNKIVEYIERRISEEGINENYKWT